MLTEVTGASEPFDDAFMNQLDSMSKENAVKTVEGMIDLTIFQRDKYEQKMIDTPVDSEAFVGALHCWVIDNNNIVRLKKLYDQIRNEE